MMISRRPSPFGELLSLRQAMDRLFEDSYVRPPGAWGAGAGEPSPLALDVSTSNDALVIEAALPGVRPDDVDITVEDGTLTIRGQSRTARQDQEPENGYLVQEIRRGEFSRSVSLPTGLEPDRAEATFEDGILTLRIPRAEQVKPRQIRINPTSSSNGTKATHSSSTSTSDQADPGSSSSGERA
jgi:HSP20 family protein